MRWRDYTRERADERTSDNRHNDSEWRAAAAAAGANEENLNDIVKYRNQVVHLDLQEFFCLFITSYLERNNE